MARRNSGAIRQQLIQEAARLLANDESADLQSARRKAAARYHAHDRRQWPDLLEIEAALADYQRLFQAQQQPRELTRLRQTAMEAMEQLAAFAPRLTGAVLRGTATADSPLRPLLFAETPEQVQWYLQEQRIPYQLDQETLPARGQQPRRVRSLFQVWAGGGQLELLVLQPGDRATPPVDPVTGRPEQGASLSRVRELLAD